MTGYMPYGWFHMLARYRLVVCFGRRLLTRDLIHAWKLMVCCLLIPCLLGHLGFTNFGRSRKDASWARWMKSHPRSTKCSEESKGKQRLAKSIGHLAAGVETLISVYQQLALASNILIFHFRFSEKKSIRRTMHSDKILGQKNFCGKKNVSMNRCQKIGREIPAAAFPLEIR